MACLSDGLIQNNNENIFTKNKKNLKYDFSTWPKSGVLHYSYSYFTVQDTTLASIVAMEANK